MCACVRFVWLCVSFLLVVALLALACPTRFHASARETQGRDNESPMQGILPVDLCQHLGRGVTFVHSRTCLYGHIRLIVPDEVLRCFHIQTRWMMSQFAATSGNGFYYLFCRPLRRAWRQPRIFSFSPLLSIHHPSSNTNILRLESFCSTRSRCDRLVQVRVPRWPSECMTGMTTFY